MWESEEEWEYWQEQNKLQHRLADAQEAMQALSQTYWDSKRKKTADEESTNAGGQLVQEKKMQKLSIFLNL